MSDRPPNPDRRRQRATVRPRREAQAVYWRRRATVVVVIALVGWALLRGAGALLAGSESVDPQAQAEPAPPPTEPAVQAECADEGFQPPDPVDDPPPELLNGLAEALGHRSFEVRDVSVSLWVEGYGEVASLDPDLALVPASNQKLFTAMGILLLLDHDQRLQTELVATGPVAADGTLDGDLVVVGGGDPLIKKEGDHSLQTVAQIVKDAGVTRITGAIVGDESRYDDVRRAPGWLDWQMPLPGGSMSALMVNSNSRVGEVAYLANPTLHNAGLVKEMLEEADVEVEGSAEQGEAPDDGDVIGALDSRTVAEMVRLMLMESDNMTAEMLTKEVGLQTSDEPTTAAGLAAIEAVIETELCLDLQGINDDASGISRDDKRSAREWRLMLQAAQTQDWFSIIAEGLPVAGAETGTLTHRFVGTPAAGDVRAKTGSTGVSVALTGFTKTEGGRDVVFSAIANGDQPDPAVAAIDALVVKVASDGS